MAYIKFPTGNIQKYHNDEYMPEDYVIDEISDEGVAQVTQEVAANLVDALDVEHYDAGVE